VTEVTRATLPHRRSRETDLLTIASKLPSSHARIDIALPKFTRPARYTGAAVGLLLAATGTGLAYPAADSRLPTEAAGATSTAAATGVAQPVFLAFHERCGVHAKAAGHHTAALRSTTGKRQHCRWSVLGPVLATPWLSFKYQTEEDSVMVALMAQVFLALIIVTVLLAIGDAVKKALTQWKERRDPAASSAPEGLLQ